MSSLSRRGEVVALIGPNGAGKTSTLYTAASHIGATGGRWCRSARGRRRRWQGRVRGLAGASPSSVRDNVRLGRGSVSDILARFPEARVAPRSPHCLALRRSAVDAGSRTTPALSGHEPRLLLPDEISTTHTPIIVRRLMQALRSAADEQGTGVLLVEQSAWLALEVATFAYVLSHGRVVARFRDRPPTSEA